MAGDNFQINKRHLSEIAKRWGTREELRQMKEREPITKEWRKRRRRKRWERERGNNHMLWRNEMKK